MFQQLITCFDSPAYMRRSRHVEAEWNAVLLACGRRHQEWLEMPLLRLAQLRSVLAGQWNAVPRLQAVGEQLEALFVTYQPQLAIAVPPAPEAAGPRVTALRDSFRRFNTRWQKFVREYDLSLLNRLREDYNAFYLLEKECAMISPRIARIGFEVLPPAGPEDLLREFPVLPEISA